MKKEYINKYLIATVFGGYMEMPDFIFSNLDIIEARNTTDAKAVYRKKHQIHSAEEAVCMAEYTNNTIIQNSRSLTFDQLVEFKKAVLQSADPVPRGLIFTGSLDKSKFIGIIFNDEPSKIKMAVTKFLLTFLR